MDDEGRFIKLYEYCSSIYPNWISKKEVMIIMDINRLDYELNCTLINDIIRLAHEEKSELEQ